MTHTELSTFMVLLFYFASQVKSVGISHSRPSHSLAGLSGGHVCDLSTIKQHSCVAVFPGRHWYPVSQEDTVSHCLCALNVVLDCILQSVASYEEHDKFIYPHTKSLQTFTDSSKTVWIKWYNRNRLKSFQTQNKKIRFFMNLLR